MSPDDVETGTRRAGSLDDLAARAAGTRDSLTVSALWKKIDDTVGNDLDRDRLIESVFDSTTPLGASYFVRMILGRMRIGIGFGTFGRALAAAYDVDRDDLEHVYAMTNDVGLTAVRARKGKKALAEAGPMLFHPYQFMNAQRIESADEIFARLRGRKGIFEVKYDGARLQIHLKRSKRSLDVRLYSRRLNDVTGSLPEVVAALRKAWRGGDAIVEGEAVAFDATLTEKQPFQIVLTRLGRKSDIEEKAREYPMITFLFDLLYLEGEDLMSLPQIERRSRLADLVGAGDRVKLTEAHITDDEGETLDFFRSAVAAGHEGLMAKDPDAAYVPGKRTERWMKLKPEFETLDVVIVGGIWGSGRRRGMLSSLVVAVRDEKSGGLKTVGKVGTGFSEEVLRDLTAKLEPLVVTQHGRNAEIEPRIVIEVDFQDIQKTSAYESGYALRIPRFRRERIDKSVGDADTVTRLKALFSRKSG
jgi:DNA ligase-1